MNKRKLSFRWFGSLTNLSTHRSSNKAKASVVPEHDGRPVGAKAEVGSQWVDNMEPHPPRISYARSSDMYTHVGTVPRSQRQKKCSRDPRDKKKTRTDDQDEAASRLKGDHVRDSPLLGALSSLSLSSLDHPSPLTFRNVDDMEGEEEREEALPMAPDKPKASPSSHDVYVHMDPVDEVAALRHQHVVDNMEWRRGATWPQETTKPTNSRQEAQGRHSLKAAAAVADGSGEYVKFSKEKFWLEKPSEEQKKQLEAELKMSGANLRSHAWYHGRIPEEVSESLVLNHGDFLVRDSQCTLGDFLLTIRWEEKTLHMSIRRTAVGSGSSGRMAFCLDDRAFDSLPALVHFYVGGQATLTRWSGAQIHRPVNRTLPLSYLEMAFGAATARPHLQEAGLPDSPSSIYHQRADANRQTEPSTPDSCISTLINDDSNTAPSRSPSSSRTSSVAPSPSTSRRPPNFDTPTSDSDGSSCYTELYPQSYVERLRAEEGLAGGNQLKSQDRTLQFSPMVETISTFRPGVYRSVLMPGVNKPLEVGVLRRVKELLADVDPRTAAKHITKADCTVARILEVSPEVQRMMGVTSGMELLTLPHGQQLRLDLLERFHTMATTLAVDVLGCTGTSEERATLLHKLIQIAAELKSNMGNMFGFAAVMRALELPQVSRLEQTWTMLRQRHTEGAILYEKTLRPFMKSLNDGRESCPLSNTTFPHVLPLLFLLEKSTALGDGAEPWETVEGSVDVVMFHLGAARTMAQLGGIYRSNADAKLQDFQVQCDILELFQTDFQMRLLWGSRGAEERQALRFAKFDQVLTALSNRLEPPTRLR